METLSRVEKYRNERNGGKGTKILYWFYAVLIYAVLFYVFYRFPLIPAGIEKNGLEMGLFLLSLLFLGIYVQSFAIISTKKVTQLEGKEVRINPWLIMGWALSLTYHVFLWLAGTSDLSRWFYNGGIVFTLTLFFFTLFHFISYFSYVHKEREFKRQELREKEKRKAMEDIKEILSMHKSIREKIHKNEKISKMIMWNNYDRNLEEAMFDLHELMKQDEFVGANFEEMAAMKTWLFNLMELMDSIDPEEEKLQESDVVRLLTEEG